MMKRALILGIGGQDGSYLAEELLNNGYEVHGVYRRSSVDNLCRIRHLIKDSKITLHQGDITDLASMSNIFEMVLPTHIFNEADQDHIAWSERTPLYSVDITYKAVAQLLELYKRLCKFIATKTNSYNNLPRFFQPVTATMFAPSKHLINENSFIDPMTPYAVAKTAAYHLCRYYRNIHNLPIYTGILFNHDSPRRSAGYLLQRICRGVLDIVKGKAEHFTMGGDLEQVVSICHAKDICAGIRLLVESEHPSDIILGNSVGYTIYNLINTAWLVANEIDKSVWELEDNAIPKELVKNDVNYIKPLNNKPLIPDNFKARTVLKWDRKILITSLIEEIITSLQKEYKS